MDASNAAMKGVSQGSYRGGGTNNGWPRQHSPVDHARKPGFHKPKSSVQDGLLAEMGLVTSYMIPDFGAREAGATRALGGNPVVRYKEGEKLSPIVRG